MNEREDGDPSARKALQTLRLARRTEAPAAGGATDRTAERAADAVLELPRRDEVKTADRQGRETPLHSEQASDGEKPRRHPRRNAALAVGGLSLAALVAAAGYLYLEHAAHFQSTDDAFFAARQFSIAPKVAGYVADVPVTDNQHVNAGDLIARIDDRDYRVAVALATAQVGAAQAGIRTIDAQLAAQQSQIAAAEAQVTQVQAALVFAGQQADRYEELVKTGSGAVVNAQQTSSQLNQQRAAVDGAKATLALAERQVEALEGQRASAEASLKQADAQRDQANLNLSYTTVTAAQSGRVVGLSAAVGQLAQPGAGLAMFVPDEIWVAANFKETQLDAMRPGQPVEISIDAYPDRVLHGHVASVQPGSGTAFSLLPAENATGNFVKIVQRVPVKVVVDDLPAELTVGPGMSVVPTVRTNPAPSLYERLKAEIERPWERS
jgi:membrane fusion protein, multidrug efflux system